MSLSYLHEKLSLAVQEMSTSTESLRNRLRISVRHSFTGFPDEAVPTELREEVSEIKAALVGVKLGPSLEADAIDRLKPSQVRRLLYRIISLRESVARAYYKRTFQRSSGGGTEKTATSEDLVRTAAQLLERCQLEKKP